MPQRVSSTTRTELPRLACRLTFGTQPDGDTIPAFRRPGRCTLTSYRGSGDLLQRPWNFWGALQKTGATIWPWEHSPATCARPPDVEAIVSGAYLGSTPSVSAGSSQKVVPGWLSSAESLRGMPHPREIPLPAVVAT